MSNVSRRTLVKGAAWAAPVVLATATIPAYAASACNEVTKFSTWIENYEVNEGEANQNASIWFDFGDITVNIPKGRTVKSVTTGFWMAKHSGTNDGSNRGWPSPTSSYVSYYGANASNSGPKKQTIRTATLGAKFWNFTGNLRKDGSQVSVGPAYTFDFLGEMEQTWSDGSSDTAWGIQTTWTAGSGDSRVDESTAYSDDSTTGCKTFTATYLGGIEFEAEGIYIPMSRQLPHWRFYKVVLDDGTVISGKKVEGWVGDPEYVDQHS